MKLAFVVAVSLVPVVSACSDPPSEPAQAAVDVSVIQGNGPCSTAHGSLTMPMDTRTQDALQCDLSKCSPNERVVVDGDTDTSITCSVVPNGQNFQVSANISYKGNSFSAAGQLGSTGGQLKMTHYSVQTQARYEGTCDVVIQGNRGVVKGGSVWARFTCPSFSDPSSAGGQVCTGQGAFLFEKCGGG